jgi:DNA invertase Pin-like site-specific DNA recombinase
VIAAIYARKSTDQAGAGDRSESVERQIAHARAYAMRKGWTVADAHVYADDGIRTGTSSAHLLRSEQ